MAEVRTISVWKALNEKKLLKQKIASVSNRNEYVRHTTEAENTINGIDKEKYTEKMKANFISVMQLHKNLAVYDAAIAQFNATHYVTIGGKEYVVAAAIARHQRLPYEKEFLETIKSQLIKTITDITKTNDRVMDEDVIMSGISRLVADRKLNQTEMRNMLDDLRNDYIRNNKWVLLDPNDLYSKLDSMIDELETFESDYNEEFNRLNVSSYIEVELEDIKI